MSLSDILNPWACPSDVHTSLWPSFILMCRSHWYLKCLCGVLMSNIFQPPSVSVLVTESQLHTLDCCDFINGSILLVGTLLCTFNEILTFKEERWQCLLEC